jgi:hypothetical protein
LQNKFGQGAVCNIQVAAGAERQGIGPPEFLGGDQRSQLSAVPCDKNRAMLDVGDVHVTRQIDAGRERHGGTADVLEKLVAGRSAFGMYGKKQSAAGVEGNISDGIVVGKDLFEG